MNIESQNSTQMEISESNNQPSLSSLLLSSKVFNDDIYDIFKNNYNINNLDDLVEEFIKDKKAIKKLLTSAIKDSDLFNLEEKNKKNINLFKNIEYNNYEKMKKIEKIDVANSEPIKIQNSYAGIASAGMDKINFKKNKILLMDKNDLNSFLSGTLENRKVVENSYHHTTVYFKFPKKAKRNILQIRSFLLSIGIPLKYISNINLVNNGILY